MENMNSLHTEWLGSVTCTMPLKCSSVSMLIIHRNIYVNYDTTAENRKQGRTNSCRGAALQKPTHSGRWGLKTRGTHTSEVTSVTLQLHVSLSNHWQNTQPGNYLLSPSDGRGSREGNSEGRRIVCSHSGHRWSATPQGQRGLHSSFSFFSHLVAEGPKVTTLM